MNLVDSIFYFLNVVVNFLVNLVSLNEVCLDAAER
jgi:hypothetical protein